MYLKSIPHSPPHTFFTSLPPSWFQSPPFLASSSTIAFWLVFQQSLLFSISTKGSFKQCKSDHNPLKAFTEIKLKFKLLAMPNKASCKMTPDCLSNLHLPPFHQAPGSRLSQAVLLSSLWTSQPLSYLKALAIAISSVWNIPQNPQMASPVCNSDVSWNMIIWERTSMTTTFIYNRPFSSVIHSLYLFPSYHLS